MTGLQNPLEASISDTSSSGIPDKIANLVQKHFLSLPRKRKPAIRDTGVHEWTPLSSIVAERNGELRCLSLATGMKCLPAAKLRDANGNGLHDWHAEVLAIRAFNHYLLSEARRLSQTKSEDNTSFILQRSMSDSGMSQPFTVHGDVRLYMYSSEAPCGDASMELTMSAQEDPTPWVVPPPPDSETTPAASHLHGRQYFSNLGIIRRKPSRPDAPPTLSKSCSDKLTLSQATSLLSSLTSLLVHPSNAYLTALIIPSASYVPAGFQRCFLDRTEPLRNSTWEEGYRFHPLEPLTTPIEFDFSKRQAAARLNGKIAPCNVSAVWGAHGLDEGLVGGVVQGRKAFEERGASALSRRRMWRFALEVAELLGRDGAEIREVLGVGRYGDVKEGGRLEERRKVKRFVWEEALKGWVRNVGDEAFTLKVETPGS